MSTHNMYFYEEIETIIPELSSNTDVLFKKPADIML